MATGGTRVTAVDRLIQETPHRFRIDRHGAMRVPAVVYACKELISEAAGDRALEQVINVACLPGIVRASYAMPDVHWGYGFPIGGWRPPKWRTAVSSRRAGSALTFRAACGYWWRVRCDGRT